MLPDVEAVLIASVAVTAIVADRIGGHGEVAQGEVRPYITFFTVIGQPFDQISGPPISDRDTQQIDCWHATEKGIRQLARAVRDALDAAGFHNRIVIDHREPAGATRLYRIAFQADFITNR